MTSAQVTELRDELAALEDPKVRAVNERHGDDHGVKLGDVRAIAKRLGASPELARELWATDDTAARLLAILVSRPSHYSEQEYDAMLRETRTAKVHDWLVGYLAGKSKHSENLRVAWFADPDPRIASAGWAITADRVAKGKTETLDVPGLLDTVESEMGQAPEVLQWQMNTTLAQIGINHPELRERALAIGDRLEVFKDYPTPPNCTSPFAPIWITEMVSRKEAAGAG